MIAELGAIQAATGSLKAAGDIAKALLDLKVSADIQTKVIELNRIILAAQGDAMTAQAAQLELLERKRELETELKQFEDWDAEKKRYHLQKFEPGTFAYALNEEEVQAGEPAHALCQNCYERRRKSILQFTGETVLRRRIFACGNRDCGVRFPMGAAEPAPPPQRQPDYKVFGEE